MAVRPILNQGPVLSGVNQGNKPVTSSDNKADREINRAVQIVGHVVPSQVIPPDTPSLPLSVEELQRLASHLGIVLSQKNTQDTSNEWESEAQQQCFEAAFQSISQGKWLEQIVPLMPRLRDRWGRTLFLAAVERKDLKCLEEFFKRKSIIYLTDRDGNNGLHLAALYGYSDLIDRLTGFFGVNDRNFEGRAPLHLAIQQGHSHIVKALSQSGADITLLVHDKGVPFTPIAWAVFKGQGSCLKVLLNDVAFNTNRKNALSVPIPTIGNVLHLAIYTGRFEMLESLLRDFYSETKDLMEGIDLQGRAPIHLASLRGDLKTIQILLKQKGANVNALTKENLTPVHFAVLGEQPEAIQMLDYLGADLKADDGFGRTPLQLVNGKESDAARQCRALLTKLIGIGNKAQKTPPDFFRRPPHNIVFKGGGAKGIGEVGALMKIHELGLDNEVARCCGTSAGAITAGLYAIGYTPSEIRDILLKKDLESFLDYIDPTYKAWLNAGKTHDLRKIASDFWQSGRALLHPIERVKELYQKLTNCTGLCHGDEFLKWFEESVYEKTGIRNCTFGELHDLIKQKGGNFKELHVFTTLLKHNSPSKLVRLSSEDPKCRDIVISSAVRCSMSIPGVFKPGVLSYKTASGRILKGEEFYGDGGLLKNFPLNAFDENKYQDNQAWGGASNRRTLGISLHVDQPEQVVNDKINNLKDLAKSFLYTYWYAQEILDKESVFNEDRVIDIPISDVGLLDFDVDLTKKKRLLEDGEKAAKVFFSAN